MSLFKAELRKLAGNKLLLFLVALLLVGNGILRVATVTQTGDRTFAEAVNGICKDYAADPERTGARLAALQSEIEKKTSENFNAYNAERRAAAAEGREFEEKTAEELTFQSSTLDGVHDDLSLIFAFNYAVYSAGSFSDDLSTIISQAYSQLRESERNGLSMSDYAYRYQAIVYNRYTALKENTKLPIAQSAGWNDFFSYSYGDVLLYPALLILASVVFSLEGSSGMLPLLRASKKGRTHTALSKIGATMLTSVLLTLLFLCSSLLILCFKTGLSDPSVPVQSLDLLRLFPYKCSILQYLFFYVLCKLIAACAFSAIVLCISAYFRQLVVSVFSGMALFGVSYWLFIGKNIPTTLSKNNLLAFSNVAAFSDRLYAVRVFGTPVESVKALPVFYLALLILALALTVPAFAFARRLVRVQVLKGVLEKTKKKIDRVYIKTKKQTKSKCRSLSIFLFEHRKTLLRGGTLLLFLLLIGFSLVSGFQSMKGVSLYGYRIYYSHIRAFEGELTDEKVELCNERMAAAREVTSVRDEMSAKRLTGEISEDEYTEYTKKLSVAESELTALQDVKTQIDYLQRKYAETGVRGWICSNEGFDALFSKPFNTPLYIFLLFVGMTSFCVEYQGRSESNHFALILRSTKNGRGKTFVSKFAVAALTGLWSSVIFYGMETLFYLDTYRFLPQTLNAPLLSFESFDMVKSGITVGQYLAVTYISHILTAILFALLVTAISCLCRSILPTLAFAVVGTALPSLLTLLGFQKLGYIDFMGWFDVTTLFCFSADKNLFGIDFGVYLLYTALFAAATALLAALGRRKFVK